MLKKKIPCIVLARKNSKGIKNKNRIKLNSIYLIEHTISYLKKEKLIDDIIVSTDDEIIANISKKINVLQFFLDQKNWQMTLQHLKLLYHMH